jgi:hypothetical protein
VEVLANRTVSAYKDFLLSPCISSVSSLIFCRRVPYQSLRSVLGIGMDNNAFLLENNYLRLFLVESGRELWVNQTYETRNYNGEFVSVFHDLLARPNKFF